MIPGGKIKRGGNDSEETVKKRWWEFVQTDPRSSDGEGREARMPQGPDTVLYCTALYCCPSPVQWEFIQLLQFFS
jgi:hypothetical protein